MKNDIGYRVVPLALGVALVLVSVSGSDGGQSAEAIVTKKAYIVKEGDTLWDISKRLYDSPYEWPKVWGKNPYIKNPHRIYPGDPIHLYTETSPVVQVPPPRPEPKDTARREVQKQAGETMALSEYVSSGILSDEDLQKAGGIVGTSEDKRLLAEGDLVYLELKEPEKAEIGQRYAVFRQGRTLHHPRTRVRLGRIYKILGYADIVDTGNGSVASARIVSSKEPIHVGDAVKVFEEVRSSLVIKQSTRLLEGCVVGSLEGQNEMAQHDVAFVDLGIQDGIEVGDELFVMEQGKTVKAYSGEGNVRLPDRKVAQLVVVKTDRTASTVLVTQSEKTFETGAVVRTELP